MKVLVGAFNQEKALVGAFSVIVKTDCETDRSFYGTKQDPLHVSGEESEDTGALDTSPDTSPVSSPEPSFRPRLPTYFLSLRNGTRVGNEDFSLNSLREAATGPARALRLEDDFGLVSSPQRVVHDSDSDIREFDFGRDSHPASFGFLD